MIAFLLARGVVPGRVPAPGLSSSAGSSPAAQAAGQAPAGLDPDAEALILNAVSAGLGTTVLAGRSRAEQAQAVIDYHLDRLADYGVTGR